jgi:hypothetical protein
MLFRLFSLSILLLATQTSLANSEYQKLKYLERPILDWLPEFNPTLKSSLSTSLNQPLSDYYSAFADDGVVTIYLGYGKDAWGPQRPQELFSMLQNLANSTPNLFDKWSFTQNRTIKFHDIKNDLYFEFTIGHERNEYIAAYSTHEIVMYHGHSRYGRGPAFDEYWNYFRMGNQFKFIEVDTRNKYFLNEEMQQTQLFPPLPIQFNGQSYFYQYKGQKEHSSYLPNDSYTKLIPGYAFDLNQTEFMQGKQIIWLYSCENIHYFKDPLRALHSDPSEKLFFGTLKPGYWSSAPAAVFIMDIARQVQHSQKIVSDMDATNDCGAQCFTVY